MKKIVHSYSLYIPPGNYFIDNLLEIYEKLRSVSLDVKITSNDYEFESFEELRQYNQDIKEISFSITQPYITIEINKWVWIYTSDDIPFNRGMVEQLRDICLKQVKPFNSKSQSGSKLSNIITILFLSVGGFILGKQKNLIGMFFLIFGWSYWFWDYYTSLHRQSSIKLKPKEDVPPFWIANKDKIIIAFISAILGGVVKVFLDIVIKS
ncbi:hypothetical protein [Desulfitobacterium metallireducens]|uniref:Uncharacterized protein n=1 Tax=Desulfitobacterium metallireducens DSM 15288 TaxID=871968 RepID=W0EHN3_9FIRM|nr:hypothetical protein [Desulfitobacterium metallireducens]AHF08586.1 hypothetical protein DESME_09050 [Desulfitobacterium metallireducens DSM 15288]